MTHDISDDEIWRGIRRRFDAGERLISRPAGWRDRPLQRRKPARQPTKLRIAGAGSFLVVGIAILLVAVMLGPGFRRPAVVPGSTGRTLPTTSLVASPTTTRGETLTAIQDGISLTARLDRAMVEPGGKVTIEIAVHNGRTSPITYFAPCDGAVEMNTTVPLPDQPPGRTWTGIEADLKKAALAGSTAQVSAAIYSVSCQTNGMQRSLAPGQTASSSLSWSAEIVAGVPAFPGDAPFTIALMGPTGYPSDYAGQLGPVTGVMVPIGEQLHVTGRITIAGKAPELLSKGQVIDSLLANTTFTKWLDEQPESTWSSVNFYLENDPAKGTIPEPRWVLQVFREQSVPRNFVLAYIDPASGAVGLDICEAPCSR